jgi:hypothetical protein
VIYFALNILGLSQIVRLLPWRLNKLTDSIFTNLYETCSKLVSEKQTEVAAAKPNAHKDILSHLIATTTLTHQQLVD